MFHQVVGKNIARILGNFGMKFGQTVWLGGIIGKYWHHVFTQISRLFGNNTVCEMLEKFVESWQDFGSVAAAENVLPNYFS